MKGAKSSRSERIDERLWLAVTALVCLAIVISWLPALELPLGDDHRGRILGRMALHGDNFVEEGWVGSSYIAAWVPYSNTPYAHHPPLSQFLHAAVAWSQGAASAAGLRFVDWFAGTLTVAATVLLVRRLAGSWSPGAFAATGLAVSGYFWLFGRSLNLVFIVIFFLAHALARERSESKYDYLALGAAAIATLQSWEGALIIGILAIYDFLQGSRRRGALIAVGVLVGFGLDLWWIESAAGIDALRGHLEERIAAANYGVVEWILRQGGFYLRFESVPVFVVTLIALIQGLRDPRFRPYVIASFLSVVVFASLFYENAWVHEYWNFRIGIVLALGMGAIGAALVESSLARWTRLSAMIALGLTAVLPVLWLQSEQYAIQFVESSKAGALVERQDLPIDQVYAWHFGGISGPRWYSWYTGLPVRAFDPDDPPPPGDFVLVKERVRNGLGNVATIDSYGNYSFVHSEVLITEPSGDD